MYAALIIQGGISMVFREDIFSFNGFQNYMLDPWLTVTDSREHSTE